MLVLSEIQKDAALRGKKARHKSAHPELEGGASTQNVQARLQRDSTRGRLAGALPGLFQIKLDGDPKVKVQIVELIKSSDNKDERDNLRVGDVVLRISSGASKHEGAPAVVSDHRSPFESIEAVRQHIKGLDSDLTLHVARRQQGGDGAAHGSRLGSREAVARLTQSEQLQVGVVESVGKLGLGLGLLPPDWYDRLELRLVRLRVTPPQRASALSLKLAEPVHGLSDELVGAGKVWVRAELERTGAVHVFAAVPWDGKAGTVAFASHHRAELRIHPLGDTLRLSLHFCSASWLMLRRVMLRRELGSFALGASAREMGEKEWVEADVRLSGAADEEVGRLKLSARYDTRSRMGTCHAATRVAALFRGFQARRKSSEYEESVVRLQCRWRAAAVMKQLRREKRSSTRIQKWWLRAQRNNRKLLPSSKLQLDPFEAALLKLPIKVLHSTSWQPTPFKQLATTAAKSALPASLLPASLDDVYLVLDGDRLRYGRLHRPQPLLVRAPLAARRSTLAALRRVGKLGSELGARAAAHDGGGGAAESAAAGQPRVPFELVLLDRRTEIQRTSSWRGSAREAADPEDPAEAAHEEAADIRLSHIDAVHVVSYPSNEWQMAVRRQGQPVASATLRLQTRSAAALNAWMHMLQPVLRLDEASSGAAHATPAD